MMLARRFIPWSLMLLASLFAGRAYASAELDCLVKPEMYVEINSPVISVLEEVLVEIGLRGIRHRRAVVVAIRNAVSVAVG